MAIRVLHATMGIAAILLAVKAVETWQASSSLFASPTATALLSQVAVVTPAFAQAAAPTGGANCVNDICGSHGSRVLSWNI